MNRVEIELDELGKAQKELGEVAEKLAKLRKLTIFDMDEPESELLMDAILGLDTAQENCVGHWLEDYGTQPQCLCHRAAETEE